MRIGLEKSPLESCVALELPVLKRSSNVGMMTLIMRPTSDFSNDGFDNEA
jgi:hypothetical protein